MNELSRDFDRIVALFGFPDCVCKLVTACKTVRTKSWTDLDLVLFSELLSRSAMLVREKKHWRKRGKTNVIWTGLYHFLFPVISISASSSISFIEHLLVVYGHARMIRKSDLC